MSETNDVSALKAWVLDYLRKNKAGRFYETMHALKITSPDLMFRAWEALMQAGDIEVVPGYHPSIFLAKYQLRVQPRLF